MKESRAGAEWIVVGGMTAKTSARSHRAFKRSSRVSCHEYRELCETVAENCVVGVDEARRKSRDSARHSKAERREKLALKWSSVNPYF